MISIRLGMHEIFNHKRLILVMALAVAVPLAIISVAGGIPGWAYCPLYASVPPIF